MFLPMVMNYHRQLRIDYRSIETTLKFIQDGIAYDSLSEEEKESTRIHLRGKMAPCRIALNPLL